MKVKFDFNLDAWIQELEIEADSVEQAEEKLRTMSLDEMVEAGAFLKNSEISNVDYEISDVTYKVRAYNIDYDVTEADVDEFGVLSDEEIEVKIAEVKNSLPQELILKVTCNPDDLDDEVADAITLETDWLVNGCSYEVLEEK